MPSSARSRVHERITEISRELLMQVKELAESMDSAGESLHGIVDCLLGHR
jgi:hypothetical protein